MTSFHCASLYPGLSLCVEAMKKNSETGEGQTSMETYCFSRRQALTEHWVAAVTWGLRSRVPSNSVNGGTRSVETDGGGAGAGWVGLKETMSIVLQRCQSSHVNTIESDAADSAVIAHTSVSEQRFSCRSCFAFLLTWSSVFIASLQIHQTEMTITESNLRFHNMESRHFYLHWRFSKTLLTIGQRKLTDLSAERLIWENTE